MFPFFLVAFQIFPFLTPCPKRRAPQKHYKNRGFRPFFGKADVRHETAIFGPQKPKFINFSYQFVFACFLLFQQQKTPNIAETPIFIVF